MPASDSAVRAPDERVVAVLLAVAISVVQSAVLVTSVALIGLPLLVLQHRLGRRFPDVPLYLLVGALHVVHLLLFLILPIGDLWFGVMGWPLGIAIDGALVATGQNTGRRRRGEIVSATRERQATIFVALAGVLFSVVFLAVLVRLSYT